MGRELERRDRVHGADDVINSRYVDHRDADGEPEPMREVFAEEQSQSEHSGVGGGNRAALL